MVRGKGTTYQEGQVIDEKAQAALREQADNRALSQQEINTLQEEKQNYETAIAEIQAEGPFSQRASTINVGDLKRKIQVIDNALDRGIQTAKGKAKDSLLREERELEERLRVDMPSREEMRYPNRYPSAVRKHMAWDQKNRKLVNRYVEIQNIIRPEAPKYVEELRREK